MSEGESLGLGIFLVVGAACYAALFIALFAYAAAHALQPPGTALMLAALAVLATTSALGYALWECTNGSAFSYFFPLHGARRMAHCTCRSALRFRSQRSPYTRAADSLTMLAAHSAETKK